MGIPTFDLSRQWQDTGAEITSACDQVMAKGHFILDENVSQLEKDVAAYCSVAHGIGVANGSDALFLALQALGIGPGDEVIVPAFTFFATAGAVARTGATPVFADIDPHTYNISAFDVGKRITTRTRAIIPVHLYGAPADMDSLAKLAKENHIYIIEDAAQAIGTEYKGRRIGSLGHIACLSFFPTKNLGCFGDGGMVVTNDPVLAEKVRILRVHGSKPKYYHSVLGINSRLDELQAAILRVKLPYLDQWTESRRHIADLYRQHLSGLSGVQLPEEQAGCRHVFHQFTIALDNRDGLQEYLNSLGIGSAIYYPLALHLQDVFAYVGGRIGDLPHAEAASKRVLSLPMFPELRDDEVVQVVEAIRAYLR